MRSPWLAFVVATAVSTLAWEREVRADAPLRGGDLTTAEGVGRDLTRARFLDREGARAYADGRYGDAIRYFEEAYRHGGPSFELWNLARCYQRRGDPERAAAMLEKYLATPIEAKDRAEAEAELGALRKKPSVLTVTSSPMGAEVQIDGKAEAAPTPLSTTVDAGPHVVRVARPGQPAFEIEVVAVHGHALIVHAPLRGTVGPLGAEPSPPDRPLALRAMVGVQFPRYGALAGSPGPVVAFHGTYRFARAGAVRFGAGGLFSYGDEQWKNTASADPSLSGCNRLSQQTKASTFSLMGLLDAAVPFASRFEVRALAGAGLSIFEADERGGDLFPPTCRASASLEPAFQVGIELEAAVTDSLRVMITPIVVQFQTAVSGVRSSPIDATGLWYRPILGLGLGVDF